MQAAKREVDGLKRLIAAQKQNDDPELSKLLVERSELKAVQERLRQNSAKQPVDDQSTTDPMGDLQKIRTETKALDLKLEDARARIEAAKSKQRDLAGRLQRIRSQIHEDEAKNIEYVRFPKEKNTSREAFFFILKFGELFPLLGPNGTDFPGIKRQPIEGENYVAMPIKNLGLNAHADKEDVLKILANAKKWGAYIAIIVYPDSFGTFRELKPLIFQSGLEFGFDVYPQHYQARFGPNGTKPPAL